MTTMADFYPFLVSSLPMLHFGMKPPFSYEQFLEICHHRIPDNDYYILSSLPEPGQYSEYRKGQRTLQKWMDFDTALRNELVKIRAQRIHADPAAHLRGGIIADSSLAASAVAAMGNPSLLEAERAIDEERWKALDHIATGHHFDVDLLITYAYKLLILIRWENVGKADAGRMLEHVLTLPRG